MLRIFVTVLAFVMLTGFSEVDALTRFGGGWQAADETYGTKGAIQIDGEKRSIRAASYSVLIDGAIDRIDIIGASAVFHVGKKSVIVYSGPDDNTIEARVGDTPVMRFVRVP